MLFIFCDVVVLVGEVPLVACLKAEDFAIERNAAIRHAQAYEFFSSDLVF